MKKSKKDKKSLKSKKDKKVRMALNYIEHLLILASVVTGYVSNSACASLVCIPIGIDGSGVELTICAITAGIKNHTLIIKKKEKKHNKIVLLAKTKLNSIEVLISRVLIDSIVMMNLFLVNNVLKEHDDLKDK